MRNYPLMNKQTIKEEILQSMSEEIDIWLDEQAIIKDGYAYETKFLEFTCRVNKKILEKSMGSLPGSRNKKNFIPVQEK